MAAGSLQCKIAAGFYLRYNETVRIQEKTRMAALRQNKVLSFAATERASPIKKQPVPTIRVRTSFWCNGFGMGFMAPPYKI